MLHLSEVQQQHLHVSYSHPNQHCDIAYDHDTVPHHIFDSAGSLSKCTHVDMSNTWQEQSAQHAEAIKLTYE